MLEPDEEYMMAKRWQEHQDSDAAHKLVTSHLRLVTRIAMGYRGYGLPIGDVISEGNAGLMQAVKRFRALCDTLFLCGIVRNIDERACSCRKVQFHPGALEHEPRMNVRFQRRALVGVLAPTGPG